MTETPGLPHGSTGPPEPVRRVVLGGALALFIIVIGTGAIVTLHRLGHWALISGPNTVGEAGKVYFAHRVVTGQSIFVTGDKPPYYASMHGTLLHASVGWIGAIFNLSQESLYGVGRIISIISTIIALWLAGLILRKLGAGWPWFAALLAIFFTSEQMVVHSVSYRPDHWILLLSTFCCYLLVAHAQDRKRWHLIVLAVIPPIAFFIKAPGMALVLPIAASLMIERRGKIAAITAGTSFVLLGAALLAIEIGSGGKFSAGLRSGMDMPISFATYISFASVYLYWIAWLMPIALIRRALPMRGETQRRWLVVPLFFAFGYVVSAIGSMRAGSNMYYFVDSYLYGMLLTVAWVADLVRREDGTYWYAMAIVLIFAGLFAKPTYDIARVSFPVDYETPMDISIRISRDVGHERRELANIINENKLKCYSDDAGLNIMLDQPQVIYPLMQTLMIRNGALPKNGMAAPVIRQEYDVIMMTGYRWKHLGEHNLSQPFVNALFKYYVRQDTKRRFHIYERRGRTILQSAPTAQ